MLMEICMNLVRGNSAIISMTSISEFALKIAQSLEFSSDKAAKIKSDQVDLPKGTQAEAKKKKEDEEINFKKEEKPAAKTAVKAVAKPELDKKKPARPAKAGAESEAPAKGAKRGRKAKDGKTAVAGEELDMSDIEAEFAEEAPAAAVEEKVKPLRIKVSRAKERARGLGYVATSSRFACPLLRIPRPMNSDTSAVPP